MKLTKDEVCDLLPQKDPFKFVTEITELIPGEKAIGYLEINDDIKALNGHFPNMPIMPGVLILEAIAQVGTCAILKMDNLEGKIPVFTGLNNVKFRQQVIKGDKLEIEISLNKWRFPLGSGVGIATVNGKVACKAELSFFLVDYKE